MSLPAILNSALSMFGEESLHDMIRGLRNHAYDEQRYVATLLKQYRETLQAKSKKKEKEGKKALVVQKLIYLNMRGYDTSFASFAIVELMSSPVYAFKRIGYLAASQIFRDGTDVVLLTAHLFRKAFTQQKTIQDGICFELGSALNCLSTILTPGLAAELLSECFALLNHSQPYVRKKAVLLHYKLFVKYPKSLRPCFPRLKDRLTDDDPSVVSVTVNVICELARRNPKNYLPLVPTFFHVLTTSKNNWTLIKVVKLLHSLVPIEPRLSKKLSVPLVKIIETSPARSLVYECVSTLIAGNPSSKTTLSLILDNLKNMIETGDQNLKYLGLLGLHELMQIQQKTVAELKESIFSCLSDSDVSIKLRALDLVSGIVSPRTLVPIVRRLLRHFDISEGKYKDLLLNRIVSLCSANHYENVEDFIWYFAVLVDLARSSQLFEDNALLLRDQLVDVMIRVPETRDFGVRQMVTLIIDAKLLASRQQDSKNSSLSYIIFAASFIVGEFSSSLDPDQDRAQLLSAMLSSSMLSLTSSTQASLIHNSFKLLISFLQVQNTKALEPQQQQEVLDIDTSTVGLDLDAARLLLTLLLTHLEPFTQSPFVEVQDRAVLFSRLLSYIINQVDRCEANEAQDQDSTAPSSDLSSLFSQLSSLFISQIRPVKPNSQLKVVPPTGLLLDEDIISPEEKQINASTIYKDPNRNQGEEKQPEGVDDDESFLESRNVIFAPSLVSHMMDKKNRTKKKNPKQITPSSKSLASTPSKTPVKDIPKDLFYLKESVTKLEEEEDVSEIPIKTLVIEPEELSNVPHYSIPSPQVPQKFTVLAGEEAPREVEEKERHTVPANDIGIEDEEEARLSDIDLTIPLEEDEAIQSVLTYAQRNLDKQVPVVKVKSRGEDKGKMHSNNEERSKKKKKKRNKKTKEEVGEDDRSLKSKKKAKSKKRREDRTNHHHKGHVHAPHYSAQDDFVYISYTSRTATRPTVISFSFTLQFIPSSSADPSFSSLTSASLLFDNLPSSLSLVLPPSETEEINNDTERNQQPSSPRVELCSTKMTPSKSQKVLVEFLVFAELESEVETGVANESNIQSLLGYSLSVELQYNLQNADCSASSSRSLPFSVSLSPSCFIFPCRISTEEYQEILTSQPEQCPHHCALRLELPILAREAALADALKLVGRVARLHLITAVNYTATFFGCSVPRGLPVALLLKTKPHSTFLSIDIKTGEDFPPQELAQQLETALTALR